MGGFTLQANGSALKFVTSRILGFVTGKLSVKSAYKCNSFLFGTIWPNSTLVKFSVNDALSKIDVQWRYVKNVIKYSLDLFLQPTRKLFLVRRRTIWIDPNKLLWATMHKIKHFAM